MATSLIVCGQLRTLSFDSPSLSLQNIAQATSAVVSYCAMGTYAANGSSRELAFQVGLDTHAIYCHSAYHCLCFHFLYSNLTKYDFARYHIY